MTMLRTYFETKMWAIYLSFALVYLLGILLFSSMFQSESGINKTVGWAFDITSFLPIFPILLSMFYFLCFGLLALFGLKTDFGLSRGQFLSFLGISALFSFGILEIWTLVLLVANLLLYIAIFIFSVMAKISGKPSA